MNLLGVLLQLFVVSRVIRYAGIPRSLRVLPLVALCGYGLMAFAPLLSLIFVAKVAENSLDYSLNNTVRHSLFLVTDREAKYKAKTFIDTLVQRLGDVLAAGCVWVGTSLALSSRGFALLNVGLVVVWLAVAFAIGRRYAQRVGPEPGAAPGAPPAVAARVGV